MRKHALVKDGGFEAQRMHRAPGAVQVLTAMPACSLVGYGGVQRRSA